VTEYLDLDDLMEIAREAVAQDVAVRDYGLLESALARPRASVFGEDAYPDLHLKAAALLPVGARVFVYSAANADLYLGPYEGRGPWNNGTFWTPSLPGDHLVIEYMSPTGTASANTLFGAG